MSQEAEIYEQKVTSNQPIIDDNIESNEPNPDVPVFSNKEVRSGFIRKVYLIVASQLIFTTAMVILVYNIAALQTFQRKHIWIFGICSSITFALLLIMGFSRVAARTVPYNYILLSVFTICEAYSLAALTSFSDSETVLIAIVMTTSVVISLTIYAFSTDADFTMFGGLFFVLGACFLVGAFLAFFIRDRMIRLLICVIGTIIFGLYLIYDTQQIIGNKTNKYSVDDYCFAAISLYLDIVTIFLYILAALSKK